MWCKLGSRALRYRGVLLSWGAWKSLEGSGAEELPVQPEIETLPGVLVSLEAAVGGMLHLTFSTEGTARL